ncbi:hypothetical protein [Nocardioides piscis]|uniref:Ig-like domain repeat protein n=1 Tax=Nocardioides piscis TaxID=2714938 RepID=A0A6G7YBI3_9ACTN|nr:hypothetical protein [Nocardioides piscis]QIK74153.1 hypothetical protein G7071_00580 [Nocardioides piscis]
MRKLATLITTAVAAGALAAPALTFAATTAGAATQVGQTQVSAAAQVKAARALTLSKSKPGSHWGQAGVIVTAKSKKKRGKITFTVAGQPIKEKKKLKKGKAKFQLPSTLAPGTYKVRAKVKGVGKAATKVVVYNSSLSLSALSFTVSQSANCSTSDPVLTGQVTFKGGHPSEGYVDAYLNGDIQGGSASPGYLTFDSVEAPGAFDFGVCDTLWDKVKELGVGTHNVKLLYTPTASYAEYVYSDMIAITVVP